MGPRDGLEPLQPRVGLVPGRVGDLLGDLARATRRDELRQPAPMTTDAGASPNVAASASRAPRTRGLSPPVAEASGSRNTVLSSLAGTGWRASPRAVATGARPDEVGHFLLEALAILPNSAAWRRARFSRYLCGNQPVRRVHPTILH